MNKTLACLLLFVLLGAFTACTPELAQPVDPVSSPSADLSVTETPPALPTPSPSPMVTPTATVQAEVELPRPRYRLEAVLNYAAHQVSVQETIHYTNRSGTTLPDLVLIVEPNNYPGVFSLEKITWGVGQPVEEVVWEGNRVSLALPIPLEPGQSSDIHLAYTLSLPNPVESSATRPVPFGYSERQTNLVDWYPFVAPYIPGKGWIAHPPSYYGENLVYETSDFEVTLKIIDQRTDLTVAASSVDEGSPGSHYYRLNAARNFALSISHQYTVVSRSAGDITVLSYFFPFDTQSGEKALQTTLEAATLYSKLFYPYPHKTLSVVEADFLDGMEYDGLFFLSNGFYNIFNGTPADYLVAIAAHETAHQWWYGLVGNDQAFEPWLDEALCTYAEQIYYAALYPEALAWWWTYRVDYYEPGGWVDTNIYNPEGNTNAYASYRNAVYLNGAHFLEDLRLLVGDETFYAFLKNYVLQSNQRIVFGQDFFDLIRKHTSQDLSGLLSKYFQYQY